MSQGASQSPSYKEVTIEVKIRTQVPDYYLYPTHLRMYLSLDQAG